MRLKKRNPDPENPSVEDYGGLSPEKKDKILKRRVLYTRKDKITKKGKRRTKGGWSPFVSKNPKNVGRQTREISLRQVQDSKGRKRNQIYIERIGSRRPHRIIGPHHRDAIKDFAKDVAYKFKKKGSQYQKFSLAKRIFGVDVRGRRKRLLPKTGIRPAIQNLTGNIKAKKQAKIRTKCPGGKCPK